MANQMVRKKVPPLSATALTMLGKIAASDKPIAAADLFNVSNSRAWGTLHILASRYLVEVNDGAITVTEKGRAALRTPTAKAKTKGKAAQRPRQPVRFS